MEPCSPPRSPQDGPRAAQDAFRRRLGGVLEPGAAQEAPRPPPGLDSRPPDLEFGASRPEFWEVFTCNMDANWHQKSCYISFLSPPEIHAYIHIHIYIYIYTFVNLLLCYLASWRGGGVAALLRVGYRTIVYTLFTLKRCF